MNLDLEKICSDASSVITAVGAFIKSEIGNVAAQNISDKSLNNLVSYVDQTAERRLVEGLLAVLPESGILGEEGSAQAGTNGYRWVIDPLDGTTNFLHGLPFFSISVALQHQEKELVMGIVYEVVRGELFYAWQGGLAYCNGAPIRVSDTRTLADSLVATGFPYYKFNDLQPYMEVLQTLMQGTRGIRRLGSAALDLAYVACGRFDMYFEYNLQAWDVCGGAFIVQQAGGAVTDFRGGDTFHDGQAIVASNGHLHDATLNIIKTHFV